MRKRLILSFISVALISIIVVVVIVNHQTSREVSDFLRRGGGWGTQGLVGSLEEYYRANHGWDGVEEVFISRGRHSGQPGQMNRNIQRGWIRQSEIRLQIADESGIIVFDTQQDLASGQLSANQLENAIPLMVDNHVVGYLYADLPPAYQINTMDPLIKRLNSAALIASVITVFLALIFALIFSHHLFRPIQMLIDASTRMSAGDLAQRVEIKGWGELDQLGKSFNLMAESLQRAEKRRRDLTADIAHELRTPLAVQRAQLEAIRDRIYECSPDNIRSVLAQNEFLTRLVEDLRTLALADSEELHLEFVESDLGELIRQVVSRFLPQAEGRGIRIEVNDKKTLSPLLIDRDRIAQVLGNLLSNALRYTPDQGLIKVTINGSDQEARVTVHDNGPGIAIEALPYIFDRFYRADKSRSRHDGGAGLGLTIAKKIARLHHGDLIAGNHPNGGAVFTLTLPIKKSGE